MFRRLSCSFLAVLALLNSLVNSSGVCSYSEHAWNCSGIESVNQLFNVSDVSLLNTTYPAVTQLAIQDSGLNFTEDLTRFFPNVRTVNLSGTSVNCTKDLLWLLTWRDRLVDPKKVLCFGSTDVSELQAIKTLNSFKYVEDNCPSGCNCSLDKVQSDYKKNGPREDQPAHIIINCSNLGLSKLPRDIPWNVTGIKLDVSNNKIEDIGELATSEIYRNVRKLDLTNNLVTTISKLKGTKWIENALELSLKGNLMSEMPLDILNSTHMDNDGYRFFLSNNPWRCDCYSVTKFQSFVAQTTKLIKDATNVTCGPDGGENAGRRIMDIDSDVVCPPDKIMEMAMIGLSVSFALLTVLTVGKLLYDYRAYRKTGQLPWLATKLP